MILKKLIVCSAVACTSLGGYAYFSKDKGPTTTQTATEIDANDGATSGSTMSDVIELAVASRKKMSESLHNYTARFVKQEADDNGVVGEEGEIFMKVQTRLGNENDDGAMRVYLRFERPGNVKGREVIWGEDIYGGRMQVKEAGMLGMMTLSLDPTGPIAMMGQRYPISEIGLVRLTEKLIERGQKDVDDPNVTVMISKNQTIGDLTVDLIQVKRAKPSNVEDDFSLAEIAFDPKEMLIVRYRSFGWPADGDEELPLQESYTYFDVKANTNLSDKDFDTTNSEYSFP